MRALVPPCAGPITAKCGRHREVEHSWLSRDGWNVSSWCNDCGAVRYWYRITEDNRQVALDRNGLVVAERDAL